MSSDKQITSNTETDSPPVVASLTVDYTTTEKVVFLPGDSLEFSVEGVPEWIEQTLTGKKQYTYIPGLEQLDSTYRKLYNPENGKMPYRVLSFNAGAIVGWILGLVIALIVFAIIGNFGSSAEQGVRAVLQSLVISLVAAMVGGWLGLIDYNRTNVAHSKVIFQKTATVLWDLNRQVLASWLLARYNVTISTTTMDILVEAVRKKTKSTNFVDTSGQKWIFSFNEPQESWFVQSVLIANEEDAFYTKNEEDTPYLF